MVRRGFHLSREWQSGYNYRVLRSFIDFCFLKRYITVYSESSCLLKELLWSEIKKLTSFRSLASTEYRVGSLSYLCGLCHTQYLKQWQKHRFSKNSTVWKLFDFFARNPNVIIPQEAFWVLKESELRNLNTIILEPCYVIMDNDRGMPIIRLNTQFIQYLEKTNIWTTLYIVRSSLQCRQNFSIQFICICK